MARVLKTYLLWILIATSLLTGSPVSAQPNGVIYQAFNERFVDIKNKLDSLRDVGYGWVQVSPPFKSIDNPIWWGRYQPVDLRLIEGPLGNRSELQDLINTAHQKGLKIIIDVVFNHMADPVFYQPALNYPQFTWWDFHHHETRPCITDFNDRYQVTHFWLCDPAFPDRRLPDLNTGSEYVRRIHKEVIDMLADMGVDGLRIDAAKHIEPDYFRDVLNAVPANMYVYGEVIGSSLGESNIYTPYMAVTDFQLLSLMLSTFTVGGSMANLVHPEGFGLTLPGDRSVVFARNHDTVMNPNFFAFADYQDALLATAFVLARGVGMPKVYRDDAYQPLVATAVRFHNRNQGQSTYVRRASEICASCNDADFLVIERGQQAVAVVNKADAWIDAAAARLPGIEPGCYRELRYGTAMEVAVGADGQRWISAWGSYERGGLRIGPRSALFFVRSSRCPAR